MNIHKQQYYHPDTIDQQAAEFAEQLAWFREKHPVTNLKPKKAALLIIDMQDFFLSAESHAFIPSMPAIIPRLKKLQDCFLDNNLSVLQTRHVNTAADAGQMRNWWGDMLTADNSLSKVITELQDDRVPIISKTQNDAFWQTDLETRLKAQGIEQVVIGGVMTHLCCESTARSAFTRGFEVFCLIDGTATYNKQFHIGSLVNLAHGFATQMLIEGVKY